MDNEIRRFGIALKEKYGTEGLTKDDITLLYGLVSDASGDQEVYPIELEAREHESSAMGFITCFAADRIDYDYEGSGLRDFIATILDDMEKENKDGYYTFRNINIYLSR